MIKINKDAEGKCAQVDIYDDFGGLAEILEVFEDRVKLQWIYGVSCYSCCVYSPKVYTEPTVYDFDSIAEYKNERKIDSQKIQMLRKKSLILDKGIFRRYEALRKEQASIRKTFGKQYEISRGETETYSKQREKSYCQCICNPKF